MLKTINHKLHTPTWLFILLFVVFILRVPSFFEPYSYGDEMIYLALGEGIRQGIPLYKEIHDNKPPLLYLFAALSGSLFWFKALLAGWHLITVFAFWKLTEVIFPVKPNDPESKRRRSKAQAIATSLFAIFTTIPLLEGNIVNSELFMAGPVVLAFYILLSRKLTINTLFIAGALFSLSALFKIPAAFDFPVIIVYWLLTEKKITLSRVSYLFQKSLPLILGFAVPVLLTFIWFYLSGSFREYVVAAYLQNFGYLSSFRPGDVEKPFLVKNGPLILRGLIVLLGVGILYIKRKRLSREFVFATIWLLFSLFAVTLSERPYPHYLIQSVGPISLLMTIFLTKKTMEQIYTLVPLCLAFIVPVYFNFWHYPVLPYYIKFINMVSGNITKEEYLRSYGDQVPRNYNIAKFIRSSTRNDQKIFVWGDGAPLYALSRRLPPIKFVADYHINDFSGKEDVIKQLQSNMPEIIVIQPGSDPFPQLEFFVRKNYGLAETIDGSQIWRLLSPKVRSLFTF